MHPYDFDQFSDRLDDLRWYRDQVDINAVDGERRWYVYDRAVQALADLLAFEAR